MVVCRNVRLGSDAGGFAVRRAMIDSWEVDVSTQLRENFS